MVPPFRGRLRGRLRGMEHGTRTEGGCPTQCPTGCPIPLPPLGRSLPSVGIPAGRLPGPRAGRTTSRDERPHA